MNFLPREEDRVENALHTSNVLQSHLTSSAAKSQVAICNFRHEFVFQHDINPRYTAVSEHRHIIYFIIFLNQSVIFIMRHLLTSFFCHT